MELLLVRHALPVRTELTTGPADPSLSDDGREQARRLAEYLAAEHFDAIYSSPMRRAMETAAPIAMTRNFTVEIVEDLAEWDAESSEYIPIEELKAAGDPRWHTIRDGVMAEASESPEVFGARVVRAIETLVDGHSSQRIAVVCHGMVINFYLAHVLGIADGSAFFYPNYTSVHRVAAARSGERSIVTLNETPHLRGSGLPIGLFQR